MFTTTEVLKIANTNARQLNWWCRDGMISGQPANPGTGHHRAWTREQVRTARALRLVAEAEIVNTGMDFISVALADADWAQPLIVELADHLRVTIDLPAIDVGVPA